MNQLATIFSYIIVFGVASGAPILKSLISTIGAEEPIASGVYNAASFGASLAVEHSSIFRPFFRLLPGASMLVGAAGLLGGRFAGGVAGGVASNAVRGIMDGPEGNTIPYIGWIIRDDENGEEYLLYDYAPTQTQKF